MRLFISFIFLFLGILIGILLLPYLRTSGIQIVLVIGVILMLMTAYLTVRMFVVRQRDALKMPRSEKQQTEVGFVVDTFQELVGKLKEKEKELERLRSEHLRRTGRYGWRRIMRTYSRVCRAEL
jgi:predicted Kef-type K+ transport protein